MCRRFFFRAQMLNWIYPNAMARIMRLFLTSFCGRPFSWLLVLLPQQVSHRILMNWSDAPIHFRTLIYFQCLFVRLILVGIQSSTEWQHSVSKRRIRQFTFRFICWLARLSDNLVCKNVNVSIWCKFSSFLCSCRSRVWSFSVWLHIWTKSFVVFRVSALAAFLPFYKWAIRCFRSHEIERGNRTAIAFSYFVWPNLLWAHEQLGTDVFCASHFHSILAWRGHLGLQVPSQCTQRDRQ